ncbi:MAG: DNA-binding protein WhiA [Clostridia bacterium]|nr:DNA-binding protein WhiA [Clostridia bacterium]MBQ8427562.1 DNA-binding protein WhiA [Clostridia bacterium]
MNFAKIVKAEICDKPIKDNHCKKAFLAGLIRGTGKLFERDGEIGLEFRVADEKTAITVGNYLQSLFDYEIREIEVSEDHLNKKDKFLVTVCGDGAEAVLIGLGILQLEGEGYTVNFDLYSAVTEKNCCLRAFIRGIFVASGSCTVPSGKNKDGAGYHLEMVFSHAKPAMQTQEKLAHNGIKTKIIRRKESFVLYIKSVEEIKNFIAFLPAPVSVLKLTDLIINRELSNSSNRMKNCDIANLNKQVDAFIKQVSAIDLIEKEAGLSTLKKELYDVAIARKENPEETLLELSERLNISKSCLNHRLRKIVAIANDLRGDTNV